MTSQAPRRRGERAITEVFFIAGALVVVIGLLYSIHRSWPAFDPLSLAMLVGIGLLLVVVCERLRIIAREVQIIADHLTGTGPVDPEDAASAGGHGEAGGP